VTAVERSLFWKRITVGCSAVLNNALTRSSEYGRVRLFLFLYRGLLIELVVFGGFIAVGLFDNFELRNAR